MKRSSVLLALVLLAGCVTKEQHRSLADSYDAWYQKTVNVYVNEVDVPSIRASRAHEAEAVALVISSAKEAAK